jgi:hypothetical protein
MQVERLNGTTAKVTVFNRGPATARDVMVYLDGEPAWKSPILFAARSPDLESMKVMLPGTKVVFTLHPNLGHGSPKEARITWTDDSKASGEWASDLA